MESCFDLGSVFKGDSDPGILGDGHVIDHRQPVLIPEDCQRLSLLQTCQKQFDLLTSGLSVGDLLSQYLLAGLGGIETVRQCVVALLVFGLIEGNVGAFFDWWKIGWKYGRVEVQIVKERIEDGANEKAVLRFSITALSFASISIFPG